MLPAMLILAGLFLLLTLGRMGGAYRSELMRRWPSVVLAGAAIYALARGALWPALALSSLSALVWILWPRIEQQRRRPRTEQKESRADVEARAILGVGANASESEIRAAYRSKMAQAHPDRGGSNAQAARLTAARDRLLKKTR